MWINWKGQCTLFRGHQRCPQGSNKQIIIIKKKKKKLEEFQRIGKRSDLENGGIVLGGVGIFQFQWH